MTIALVGPSGDINIINYFNLYIETSLIQRLTPNYEFKAIIIMNAFSGCGKSTCISLLERFYDPNAGILVYNKFFSSIAMKEFRKSMDMT